MAHGTEKVIGPKVMDEGVTIVNPANSFDFVGGGVTATAPATDQAQISIPGAAAGSNSAVEKLTGTQSGTSVTLDLTGLANTFVAIRAIFKDGQALTPGDTQFGWTRVTNTITILNADAGQAFLVDYTY